MGKSTGWILIHLRNRPKATCNSASRGRDVWWSLNMSTKWSIRKSARIQALSVFPLWGPTKSLNRTTWLRCNWNSSSRITLSNAPVPIMRREYKRIPEGVYMCLYLCAFVCAHVTYTGHEEPSRDFFLFPTKIQPPRLSLSLSLFFMSFQRPKHVSEARLRVSSGIVA